MPAASYHYSAWAEIDLKALRLNFRSIKRLTRRREVEQRRAEGLSTKHIRIPLILSVVKADAYGHGMLRAARVLVEEGVDFLGVSEWREGVRLRDNGLQVPVLVLEPPLSGMESDLIKHDLTAAVGDWKTALALNRSAAEAHTRAKIHIKVDTGMGRLGVRKDAALKFITRVMCLEHLDVQGLCTHFPAADTDMKFTRRQIDWTTGLVAELDQRGLVIPFIHGANSMGVAGYPTRVFNVVRPGLMLYGLYPSADCEEMLKLKPVMTVKTRVVCVKEIQKGQSVSYGRTFKAKGPMRTATLAIGYNDGFFRALSNKAEVLIGGQRCRVLGRVTMDQTVVDVTHVPQVRMGSEAVIIGRQGTETICADEPAAHAKTINYEIVCALGNRLPRIYKS